jgi:hypothetical protein
MMQQGAFKDASEAYAKAATAGAAGSREVFEEHARRAAYYASLGALKVAGDTDEDKASH